MVQFDYVFLGKFVILPAILIISAVIFYLREKDKYKVHFFGYPKIYKVKTDEEGKFKKFGNLYAIEKMEDKKGIHYFFKDTTNEIFIDRNKTKNKFELIGSKYFKQLYNDKTIRDFLSKGQVDIVFYLIIVNIILTGFAIWKIIQLFNLAVGG